MKTAEEILNERIGHDYGTFHPIMRMSPVLSAMQEYAKQIAELAWDAGSQRENWDLTDDDYGKRPIPPTKEQFLNSIFNPEDIGK